MENKLSKILIYGFIVALVQIFLINSINFLGYFNPKVFSIFLLLLPKNIKHVTLLFIGFFYGMAIDFMSQTYGIAMASSVFICLIKPYFFKLIYSKREDDETDIRISIQGLPFILRYLFFSLILFHLYYFFIELGEISNIIYILAKTICSSALSIVLYLIIVMMFTSRQKTK